MQIASKASSATPSEKAVALTLQVPPEKHDYAGDVVSGLIGLLGALAGAYAAYRWGLKATREAKRESDRELDVQLSFAVVHKLNKVYGAQKAIRQQIEQGRARLEAKAANQDVARIEGGHQVVNRGHVNLEVRPLANLPERVVFTPDEVAAAGRVGGQEALHHLMVLDNRHNASIELLGLYREKKAAIQPKMGDGIAFDGAYVGYAWTLAQYQGLQPFLHELDELIATMHENAVADEKSAFEALKMVLQGKANKEEGAGAFRVPDPSGEMVEIARQ
ncbi:MAG: hypothetical protein EON56_00710 [Alphaproteobacteria bacterium]|nr:MAG: hypothetical protein EON56_00710 [Alphaproteobacteria bacterium]